MKEFLYFLIGLVSKIHNKIMTLNDGFERHFTDKELHFLVIGILGMAMIFVIYPFFKWLAKKKCILAITWIYVFTLIIVITFAIEIGQGITNTGIMDFGDIMFGVVGFIAMFLVYAIIRAMILGIGCWIKKITHNFEDNAEPNNKVKTSKK